jgi:glycosyltransferase involved in cell wall biosynthesis
MVEHAAFRGPAYIGQVPRDTVRSEFAQADVFAFPTLAEGLAMVHLEAIACGVPVVTTPQCGAQVRDGEDGFIVPVRDARALADGLERIISDRQLRDRMSRSAKQRARQLNWSRFGQLLLAATRNAMQNAAHSAVS